jgi:catechol 2,3-dioxygenase-like lactoylglutathione lyase family enzyme
VFDHVTIRVSDRDASTRFYDTVLPTLGIERTATHEEYAEWDDFSLAPPSAEKPVTRNLHVAFVAPTREHVDAFWRAGVEAGYRSDGEPGPRPQYRDDYYGSFLLDPDGNSVEAVHHGVMREGGVIDHLWIRVADVAAATRFYDLVARHAGFAPGRELEAPTRAIFNRAAGSGSFSVVSDERPATENVHLAFPAGANAEVDAFHADLIGAGYRNEGDPGERAIYHAGYYGAFVLDPDGNNVELVCHNR